MDKISLKIKYPKLLLLLLTFVLAYFLFYERNYAPYHNFLLSLGYFGVLIAGIFYAYGFTAAPATAVLLSVATEKNLFLAALIGGIGALIGDLIIFIFIRYSFAKELRKLSKEKIVIFLEKEEKILFGHYKKYALASFAGFLIASPLPTEIGVTLMASFKHMSIKKFMVVAYILHTIGIFIILSIGNLI